jgi:hypothetical protein
VHQPPLSKDLVIQTNTEQIKKEPPTSTVLEAYLQPTIATMPMGTIAQMPDGIGDSSRQNYSMFSAYTSGESSRWNGTHYPDDRIASHGDESPSRPTSQGVVSATSSQSRPNTSQGMTSSTSTLPNGVQGQQRPGSNGTDVASPPTMRHGFAEAYSSEEYLTMLEQVYCTGVRLIVGVLHVLYIRSA